MPRSILLSFALLFLVESTLHAVDCPNILFIAIDDLNDWVGCLGGHPQVQTPNIDALARRGVLFTEAHCPAPVCGPSRAAIMSGLRPVTTGVYSNDANYPKKLPGVESMPEYLRHHGYHTMGAGKLFHGDKNYPEGSFDEYAPPASGPIPGEALSNKRQTPTCTVRLRGKTFTLPLNGMPADRTWQESHTFDWGPVDLPDEDFQDPPAVHWAVQRLKEQHGKPFFLGVGFHLPHQPLYAPKRFHDMYSPQSVQLPPTLDSDLDDLSEAGRDYALIPTTSGRHATVVKYDQWKNAVSSYLATTSFVDFLVGQLTDALGRSDYGENTWIILWSDHGWHLGEKEHWGKATGWYRSTRVPLILVPPQGSIGFVRDRRCARPVNLLDLFPTIVDAAGLPAKSDLEGRSLLPLVRNPEADWAAHTVTTFGRGNHAITTPRWRYLQYFDGSAELYDRETDPLEWHNQAGNADCREIVERLKRLVPGEPQWKHFIRCGRFKAVVPSNGDPIRLFNHDKENHLEERFSEAADYPEVVAAIRRWLEENRPTEKRLIIPDAFTRGPGQ
jgi:arylsulfatase A-like enzyme